MIDFDIGYRTSKMPKATIEWRIAHGYNRLCAESHCILSGHDGSHCVCRCHKTREKKQI